MYFACNICSWAKNFLNQSNFFVSNRSIQKARKVVYESIDCSILFYAKMANQKCRIVRMKVTRIEQYLYHLYFILWSTVIINDNSWFEFDKTSFIFQITICSFFALWVILESWFFEAKIPLLIIRICDSNTFCSRIRIVDLNVFLLDFTPFLDVIRSIRLNFLNIRLVKIKKFYEDQLISSFHIL